MFPSLYFDKADRDLLRMVNRALDRGEGLENRVFNMNLHPHGILELATTHEFRVAHAVINLLSNLSAGQAEDRLQALRALHDEVLHSAHTPFRYNTGRVLIQIMKEIVRSRHDEFTQLKLMHDFRRVASGNPRIVRHFLDRFHLLEMPEEWNQLTMDHHVHDANTKGRKNPTHLIMDAWVKGIRMLTVIYYNYVEPDVARELLHAAEVVGISVRLGVEFTTRFRDREVSVVWAPRGFSDTEGFLAFLNEKNTQELMEEGRKASLWVKAQVLDRLDKWNTIQRCQVMRDVGVELPVISREEFLAYVRAGQASLLHLAEIIHRTSLPVFQEAVEFIVRDLPSADADRKQVLEKRLDRMNTITPEIILETWLTPRRQVSSIYEPEETSDPNLPSIMSMPVASLLSWLASMRSGFRITLQLADLHTEDVLELLWDGQGFITHLELFNLKEWHQGRLKHLEAINELQRAINDGSVLRLKQIIRGMIRRMEASRDLEGMARCSKFRIILRNIPTLQAPYKVAPLGSRIGTDSTSNSSIRHGMGLAVLPTLPPGAQRQLAMKNVSFRPTSLPVELTLHQRQTWSAPQRKPTMWDQLSKTVRRFPGFSHLGLQRKNEWLSTSATIHRGCSNVITMGGINGMLDNGLRERPDMDNAHIRKPGLAYLNTHYANVLKVLAGFIPALLVFSQTQEWWVLAVFGAPIWFAITGLRNIAQAVLGGGGVRQKSLLRWTSYVDWTRISDSLMFTGLSVVLLEYGVRSLLLEDLLGITVANNATLVFSVISAANGLYIAWHNVFRGFPREAVIGNLFRSVLAIPLSMFYYDMLLQWVDFLSVVNPTDFLQPGAAIISKAASDTVAGLIEGVADRNNNRRLRSWDYHTKLGRLFNCFTSMELAFPDTNMLIVLAKPRELIELMSAEHRSMLQALIINALDLMYLWMYQPHAQQTLVSAIRHMTQEERILLYRSQLILLEVRDVSQLFVDGLVGWNFARALSFYLDSHTGYLRELNRHCSVAAARRNIS